MAFMELHREKLKHNFEFLNNMFQDNNIEWGIVTKLLCGNRTYLREVVDLGIEQVCDSRVSNLKVLKSIAPDIETVYIKPPAKRSLRSVVKYADISLNTELYTINLLNDEAGRQEKIHKIIIMIEMGDLREGVLGDRLIEFYGSIFDLPNIEVIGIGTNLNCLYGIMPSQDKLIQLGLYKQLIEIKFNRKIPYVSGGSSVTIPLLVKGILPVSVDHFRVGESLFFGKDLFTEKLIKGMKNGIFKLHAEIIELTEKPIVPTGEIGSNLTGEKLEFDDRDLGKKAYRAILDIGLLDINIEYIELVDKKLSIAGASSDMIVVDLGTKKPKYKVGDLIEFKLNYMGALHIMNSNYIDKKVV
ncbi:MAG: alanine/ornithine racemase family PLP-dependent enzyme [Bacteroidales bacterium]